MANRAMKQKENKAKKLSREAGDARKYGADPANYREEMLSKYPKGTPRPSKAEREADTAERSEHFAKAAKGQVAGRATDRRTGKLVAGRDAATVENETAVVRKEYIKARDKNQAKSDSAVSKVDLTPAQKESRKSNVQKRFAKEKAEKAKGTVVPLPEAQAKGTPKFTGAKKVGDKWKPTGGAAMIPGEGSAGILNPGNVARTAGTTSNGKRRRIERKAAYNAKKSGATAGYTEAAKLGTRQATSINTKNEAESNAIDLRARNKAARLDSSKDSLKGSMFKRSQKMPEGPEKTAIQNTAEGLIREPKVNGVRGGAHKVNSRPDERNITQKFTRSTPVGAPRKTDITSALSGEKIKMSRAGEIGTQAARPKETPIGVLGSHEDRLHRITKDFQVPAGDKSHDIEPVHLRSYLKSKAESANVRYNEQDMVGAVYHAKHNAPEKYAAMHKEALVHRTKRIGQITQQREKSASKAKETRALNSEGTRQKPRALRVMSNVKSKFTEVPSGGKEA
jgi:hypothetical protein